MNVFILYKTVRTETGEYYIGVHGIDTNKYPKFNDPYLGSGDRILASEKKYGKKAFKRTILSISESRDVVLALEAAIVTVEMISDPLCLNVAPGGRGGVKGVSNPGASAALKGIPKSVEHNRKNSESHKGVPKSPEHCQAISDAQKGTKHSVETRQAIGDAQRGVPKGPQSAETRQAISDALKGVPKSPEHCQAISDAKKGVPGPKHSAETRQAISDVQKGVPKGPMSAEHRQALSNAKKGTTLSVEHRQAISKAKKERQRQKKLAKMTQMDLSEFTQ